jgi:hypothetical protein
MNRESTERYCERESIKTDGGVNGEKGTMPMNGEKGKMPMNGEKGKMPVNGEKGKMPMVNSDSAEREGPAKQ